MIGIGVLNLETGDQIGKIGKIGKYGVKNKPWTFFKNQFLQ